AAVRRCPADLSRGAGRRRLALAHVGRIAELTRRTGTAGDGVSAAVVLRPALLTSCTHRPRNTDALGAIARRAARARPARARDSAPVVLHAALLTSRARRVRNTDALVADACRAARARPAVDGGWATREGLRPADVACRARRRACRDALTRRVAVGAGRACSARDWDSAPVVLRAALL